MSTMPTAVLFGYAAFGCAALDALLQVGYRVLLVVTYRNQPGELCWWDSLAERAATHGIPVLLDADLTQGSADSERVRSLQPELILSSFYRDLIGKHLLELPPRGAWNLHPSLLPKYRGRAPINWQLVHGETRGGMTLHRMVSRADAGSIIAQQQITIDSEQDAYGLTLQLLAITPPLLYGALFVLANGQPIEQTQDLSLGSVFPRRTPADGWIDWSRSARDIHNLVRAVAPPWPGARCKLGDDTFIIARSRVISDSGRVATPGTVLPDGHVACGEGVLGILSYFPLSTHHPITVGSHLNSPQERSPCAS